MGLDWTAIRAEYEKTATPEELGIVPPKPKAKQRKSRATGRPPQYVGISRPTYDPQEILSLFKEGLRVTDIAAKLGCHRSTVARCLDLLEVPPEARQGGPVKREKCAKGLHSMKDAIPSMKGGSGCRGCKQARDREYQRKRRARSVGVAPYASEG